MELLEVIQRAVGQYMKGSGLTDLAVGTVTGVTPLKITLEATRLEVGGEALWLTEGVVEKKIPVLAHGHTISVLGHSHRADAQETGTALGGSYNTAEDLSGIICVEHGAPLPVRDGYILLNRGLEAGDKVLLLRVLGGQGFIILSRIFEGG